MPKLRDYFKSDLDTFISEDEFAAEHDIDGKIVKCIVDEDIFKERNLNDETRHFEGVFNNKCSIFIKASDIEKPSIGQSLHIDGFMYLVANVTESDGIYEIELMRNDY